MSPRSPTSEPIALFTAVGLLCLAAGCGAEAPACPGQSSSALVSADLVETHLGMTAGQQRAVVAVSPASNLAESFCTGTIVAGDWAVTAAHCVSGNETWLLLGQDVSEPELVVRVDEVFVHESVDVALLGFSSSEAAAMVSPLALLPRDAPGPMPGDLAELVGFGDNELGEAGVRRFLVEPITAVSDRTLAVSGEGQSGACGGDSGGPLLLRDADGRVRVAGLLSAGSSSCTETDLFVPAAAFADLADTLLPPDSDGPLADGSPCDDP